MNGISTTYGDRELVFRASECAVDRLSLLQRWQAIETVAVWFLLLNCLDATLTYILLNWPPETDHDPYVVEGNRFASYCLEQWGFQGMFALKLISATLVCGIAYVISFRNMQTARRLLTVGGVILSAVVVYSVLVARYIIQGDTLLFG